MITVLCVGGTERGEYQVIRTEVTGQLANLMRLLDPERFRGVWVPYPAAYGWPMSYAESVKAGAANVVRAVAAAQGSVMIVGYSQGAVVAKTAVNDMLQRNRYLAEKIVGVGLVADPTRPAGAMSGWLTSETTYGIAGQTWIGGGIAATLPDGTRVESNPLPFPVWWIVAPTDPITDLPAGNALRSLFDLSEFASLNGSAWAESLIARAKSRQWQRWWSVENWQTWGGVIAYLRGYLIDGRHTLDYVRGGHLQRLASIMQAVK